MDADATTLTREERPVSLLPPPVQISGYRLADLAAATGLNLRSIRLGIASGRIRAVPVPHNKLIPVEEAERLVAEGLRQRAPGAGRKPREGPPP